MGTRTKAAAKNAVAFAFAGIFGREQAKTAAAIPSRRILIRTGVLNE